MPAIPTTGPPIYTPQQKVSIVQQAASKYHVPAAILYGVWGAESDFGKNTNVSSAGAIGNFQFIPSTARAYKYPLVSTPDVAQFTQQADAAAHYLSDLYKSHGGNWTAALNAYNGNGYGASPSPYSQKVNQYGSGLDNFNPLPGVSIPNPISGVESVANAIGTIVGFLTNPTNWLRIGEVIAGLLLMAMGLRSMTGSSLPTIAKMPVAAAKAAVT